MQNLLFRISQKSCDFKKCSDLGHCTDFFEITGGSIWKKSEGNGCSCETFICDPMLVKPKYVWEAVVFFEKL